ncbi:Glyoxalase/bleomycin resistance protein/dioxygenase [hydrothermal vent metagenome]|uniref:Glyoxalase/bleomycin resistance protein/dioxygenase n=1 Tax=hydrothermal vent metagenome TaxID=652676 RepID=A0A3B0SW14_9ZZZZ
MTANLRPFHLAIPVDNLERAEAFYRNIIGCGTGRRSNRWIDFNFFGHQLVVHLAPEECGRARTNEVDGKQVPARHFGVVLERGDWQSLADRLRAAQVDFIIEPGIRFAGEAGEQGTFFLADPSGNALEFKYFEDLGQLFAV